MRHDWTLFCSAVSEHDSGSIDVGQIITALRLANPARPIVLGEVIPIDVPLLLVTQWAAEVDSDKRIYSGVLQVLAPGGEEVLDEYKFEFDLQDKTVIRMIHAVKDIRFAGKGTYEFHVVLDSIRAAGEWGRACITIN